MPDNGHSASGEQNPLTVMAIDILQRKRKSQLLHRTRESTRSQIHV